MTTVLITGANRGLGLALARQYAANGAEVIACCRDPERAEELKNLVVSAANQVRTVQLEVSDEGSIASLKRALGDQPIDIVINNAGINGTPQDQTPERIDPESWLTTLRVNALAPMLIAQALRGNLLRGREKKLVAITSDFGSVSIDWPITTNARERYAYRASKAALNSGMRALSRDWAEDGILVGLLNPGFVRTDMTGPRGAASAASISAEDSARGLISRIGDLTPATSGSFQDYQGKTIPW
ncbi:SDR family oxidoreductase [Phyllobacterium chamaecytisi]|uniref:SDR family oxidoreductase n=1 Tax=Phyllobacterium chamaecytisi TaxID=2876082 RepID=UPI001CC956C7|nr:SDR family oxidoreductase [Phyllobacterium sp. KW56]MBZ9603038.1 SDR family oxidoreductase [Phyllobacterium sp. KW56]